MDASFWHNRWQTNDIGFHEDEGNALFASSFEKLSLGKGSRVFLPLCGKTLDIAWLLARGYRVAGAELSPMAIDDLFTSLGVEPEITELGKLKRYRADNIDIFVGDLFDLEARDLGPVDAIYDRAAMVAMPPDLRPHYTAHLMKITERAPLFLIALEFDQSELKPPPFCVFGEEVRSRYETHYQVTQLKCKEVEGGLKGICYAQEVAWLMTPK